MNELPTNPSSVRPRHWSLKILIGAGIGMILGFGTCTISAINNAGNVAGVAAGLFFLSLGVLIITCVALLVEAIMGAFRK